MRNNITKLNQQHSLLKIKLLNFRSYKEVELSFSNKHVVLCGPNGSGKTNFLEAISLLMPGKGLRSSKKEYFPFIENHDQSINNDWAIHYTLKRGENIHAISTGVHSLTTDTKSSRRFKFDGNFLKSKDISQLISMNWITPTMHNIINGSESLRRNFFDRMISALNPSHKNRLNKLEKLFRERTKLLEKNIKDESWFSIIEQEISQLSIAIIVERQNFTAKLDAFMGSPNSLFFPKVRIIWSGMVEEWLNGKPAIYAEEKMGVYLEKERLDQSFRICGPSNSALKIWFGDFGKPSELCSTGQQKSILVSIILAYSKFLKNKKEFPPILLLDEATAHLDEEQFHAFFEESLLKSSQIWMTGTDRYIFKKLEKSANLLELSKDSSKS